MTQEQLAARTRLTREYVSLLELNQRTPTIFVFIRLARALGRSPAEFIAHIESTHASDVALASHVRERPKTEKRARRR
jgi:transcriptional regulator with XRE-family HTH domain